MLAAVLAAYDAPARRHRGRGTAGALATLGRRCASSCPDGVLEGSAIDVEPDGRLVVVDACARDPPLDVGDVVHLRTV